MADFTNVLLKRVNNAGKIAQGIQDGKILFDTESKVISVDEGSLRIDMGTPVDTVFSSSSTNAIANSTVNAIVPLVYANNIVPSASFVTYTASGTEETAIYASGYIYKADITLSGMTANHVPTILVESAYKTIINPRSQSSAGSLRIYSKSVPVTSVTLLSIFAVRGV